MRISRRMLLWCGLGLLIWGLAACTTATVSPPAPSPAVTPTALSVEAVLDDAGLPERYPVDRPLAIRFNQPMEPDSAKKPLILSPTVKGSWTWNSEATELVFTPTVGFEPGTRYQISLDPALRAAAGVTVTERPVWEIEIARLVTVSGCEIAEVGPCEELSISIERQPIVHLTFSELMDEAAVRKALAVTPAVKFALTLQGSELWITPTEPLTPETAYQFVLAKTATDLDGRPLAQAYSWGVRVEPPAVTAEWPARPELSDAIVTTFKQPMDPASVQAAWLLTPALPGELSWDEAGQVFTWTVATVVTPELKVTLGFSGVLTDAEQTVVPLPGPFDLQAPPLILGVTPRGDAATPAAAFQIAFARRMDKKAVQAAFSITPTLEGDFSWEGNQLSFNLKEGCFSTGARYTVTLSEFLTDTEGVSWTVASPVWSFGVGEAAQNAFFAADLADGSRLEVIGIGGRRNLPFKFSRENDPLARCVTAAIYPLTPAQFVAQYRLDVPGATSEATSSLQMADLTLARRWAVGIRDAGAENWQELRIPTRVASGLYWLVLEEAGRPRRPILVVLTQNTVLVKRSGAEVFTWVSDLDGKPLENLSVQVYGASSGPLLVGNTDAQGIFRGVVPANVQPLLLLVGDGDNVTAAGLTSEWQSTESRWAGWRIPQPISRQYPAYLYTDRPLYQPGEEVNFKAVMAIDSGVSLSRMPDGVRVMARMRDAGGEIIVSRSLTVSVFGTISGTFSLAKEALPGRYGIELDINSEIQRHDFWVESVPEMQGRVTVVPSQAALAVHEPLSLTVTAWDKAGTVLAGAPVTLTMFERVMVGPEWDPVPSWVKLGVLATGKTDAQGVFSYTLPMTLSEAVISEDAAGRLGPVFRGFEAQVGKGENAASRFTTVQLFKAAERISGQLSGIIRPVSQTVTSTFSVGTLAGLPVGGRALNVSLRSWNTGARAYREITTALQVQTRDDGLVDVPVTLDQPGQYELVVSGKDALGNAMSFTTLLFGMAGDLNGWRSGPELLSLVLDRESYNSGESAQLLIGSNYTGTALLTFERSQVRSAQVVTLTPPATILKIPVQVEDMANLYVALHGWRAYASGAENPGGILSADSGLYRSVGILNMPTANRRLFVTASPDRLFYAPGDEITLTVRVGDSTGQGVSAELSLDLADETLYQLNGVVEPSIYDAFYQERGNRVRNFDAFGWRRGVMAEAGEAVELPTWEQMPHSAFTTVSWWLPVHTVPADGVGAVQFKLPDQSGLWRITVRAVTEAMQVGEATVTVVTQK